MKKGFVKTKLTQRQGVEMVVRDIRSRLLVASKAEIRYELKFGPPPKLGSLGPPKPGKTRIILEIEG